jgi:hypothetical protein
MLPFRAALSLLLPFALVPLVSGCANGSEHVDPCKRAFARLVEECDYEVEGTEGVDFNCTGSTACLAICLEESPCEDVRAQDGEFAACAAGCE